VSERAHLSIGEVLALLQEEFPDVTISKIRFLESQGLLDPERTPSGYRKFYEPDVERLRWILRQQRENFLPLKVIKGRLDEAGDQAVPPPPEPPRLAAVGAPLTAVPEPEAPSGSPLDTGLTSIAMTGEELAAAAGITLETLADLERFGLVASRTAGQSTLYDDDALLVAQVAGAFLRHGVEPRHLRMYKVAVDREAAFLEQIVTPMLKQRNPAARRQAVETVEELTVLGQRLRASLLRSALQGLLGP